MALIYPDMAVISVGMSCQTAFQLSANRRFLDRLAGAESEVHSTPFDWLICPIEATLNLLSLGRFFPDQQGILQKRNGRIVWPETGAYYWHEPKALSDFGTVHSKFQHLEATWRSLASRRVVAIWSNSQANLEWSTDGLSVDYSARESDFARLETALRRWFPRLTLCPVVRDSRIDPSDPPTQGSCFPYNEADSEVDWQGNRATWRNALQWAIERSRQSQAD